ncbi:MAG TPA: NADH:ubiquinone oxidoreductase [Rhodospirillales bacterium]|nr:NADH:ubiquinone oxidoreductase [Rhodospirillales bacterium]
MSRWIIKGLKTGVVTTRYPRHTEDAPGVSPGLPRAMRPGEDAGDTLGYDCPTGALRHVDGRLVVERGRCVHCFRCVRNVAKPAPWEDGFEWTAIRDDGSRVPGAFQHSIYICVIDAGGCGACINEIKHLNNPYYNIHRLGFFITPTPRKADLLLVVGPVTDHMKVALQKTYDAMPTPKRVMAIGACAISGGVFGSGFVTGAGIADVLPVDVTIPGCPPPPLAILHGLLVLAGRKDAAQALAPSLKSTKKTAEAG